MFPFTATLIAKVIIFVAETEDETHQLDLLTPLSFTKKKVNDKLY